jgi:cytoskeletal protein CcmA (bactofilin family)
MSGHASMHRGFPSYRRKEVTDMFKSKARDKALAAVENAAESIVQPQRSFVERAAARPQPTTKAGTASCIGSDMSIVGNIACNGSAQVFGRIEGELRASELLIGDGAHLEGNVIAQDVTVCGRVKGTIRAVRVRLRDGGAVEGDIFHRSLSIDENSVLEGSSRRVENPAPSSSVDAKCPQKEGTQSSDSGRLRPIDPDLRRVESILTQWSDLMTEPKQ